LATIYSSNNFKYKASVWSNELRVVETWDSNKTYNIFFRRWNW